MLQQNQKLILWETGPVEVIAVTEAYARVRPLTKRECSFTTRAGTEAKFSAPSNPFNISATSEADEFNEQNLQAWQDRQERKKKMFTEEKEIESQQ